MRKELGKIQRFEIGQGGYDEAMFGLSVTLGGKGWGVNDFDGTWSHEPNKHHQWSVEDQSKIWSDMIRRVMKLMKQAKVKNTKDMVGIPVEVSFNGSSLDSWRVLEEVL